jgi:hypothetical protein
MTLNDNDPEVITSFLVATGEGPLPTNVVPSPAFMASNAPFPGRFNAAPRVAQEPQAPRLGGRRNAMLSSRSSDQAMT